MMMNPAVRPMVIRTLIGIDGSGINEKTVAQFAEIIMRTYEYAYKIF